MSDKISSLADHPKFQVIRQDRRPSIASRFTDTDDLSPEIVQAIDIRISQHRQTRLDENDRRALAENLGMLLQGLKEQRGLLTRVFVDAEVASSKEESTKRLPRYVRFPGARQEPLARSVGKYHKLGTAAAKFLNLSKGRLYARLFKDTTFLTEEDRQSGINPAEAAVRNSLQPLLAMLEMMVASTIRRYDLQSYFRTIAHYSLESRNEGESYFTNDHPVLLDLSPQERWIEARLDLLPAVALYSLQLDSLPSISATIAVDGTDHEMAVSLWEDCTLVIAPLGRNGTPEACLVRSKRIVLRSQSDPGVQVSLFPWSEFTPGIDAAIVGKVDGHYRPLVIKAAQPVKALADLARDLAAVDVSALTLDSLYGAVHQRPLAHGMARTLEENLGLTYQFKSPAAAPAQSLAAFLERNLRDLPRDDPARLDNQLNAEAHRLSLDLQTCCAAIQHQLETSYARFRREQEGAEIVTLHSSPKASSHPDQS